MERDNHSDSVAMTIAGSDSGGGAGIQADLKTFEAFQVMGTSVITALTAQNSCGVQGVWGVEAGFVRAQFNSVYKDFKVAAIKTGMLFDEDIITTVVDRLQKCNLPIVVDPVMVSTSGHMLLKPAAVEVMSEDLLPLATVITPNLAEARVLTGFEIQDELDMERAADALNARYPNSWILLKGGHMSGTLAKDILVGHSEKHWLEAPRYDTFHTHGTGCTLSAAITAGLAKGWTVPQAVSRAKNYVNGCIQHPWAGLGKGHGSLKHFSTQP
jgi:hydroxymethylpyrimidine/phosphomethylpyrimidine kinase